MTLPMMRHSGRHNKVQHNGSFVNYSAINDRASCLIAMPYRKD